MLRKFFKKFVSRKNKQLEKLHLFKTYWCERLSIYKKRKLYKSIRWTPEQTQEFNSFWIKNYGQKIPDYWHKLYQAFNGTFDVRYFPEMLYTTKLELILNPYLFSSLLEDKSLVELLYGGFLPTGAVEGIRVPQTYVLCSNGYYYNGKREIISQKEAFEILADAGIIVLKPTVGGSSGRGVRIVNLQNYVDQRTNEQLTDILNSYGNHWIAQEKLTQCSAIDDIYNGSINTVRITTYVCEGRVYHVPMALRIGSGGGEVDNIHAGGMGVGINEDGTLLKTAFRLGYGNRSETFTEHPDSHIVFEGYRIPNIGKIIDAAYKLHGRTPNIGMISWDIMLDENEEPVLIEINLIGQGVWFPQIISSSSLFGVNTEKMLAVLKNRHRK